MNLRAALTVFGLLVLLPCVTRAALPTPLQDAYLVYSGTASVSAIAGGTSTIKTTAVTFNVFLVIDLANPSNYSLLTYNSNTGYHIYTRILSDDGTSMAAYRDGVLDTTADPAQNFLTTVANYPATSGYGVLRFSNTSEVDPLTFNGVGNDYKNSTQVFATGALSGLSLTAANTLLPITSKGKISGVYTLNGLPVAITNYIGVPGSASTVPYASKYSGTIFDYDYDPTLIVQPDPKLPNVAFTSLSGTVSLSLDTNLSTLANVGGSFKLIGKSATPMSPVSARLTTSSSPTVYEAFLYEIAQAQNYAAGYVPAH